MSARGRRALGVWMLVGAIALALHVDAPFPGGALLAIGGLGIGGIVTIARTGAFR